MIGIRVAVIDTDKKEHDCYVAGYDRRIGITIKNIENAGMMCLNMHKASNEMFDFMTEQIKSGTVDIKQIYKRFPSLRGDAEKYPVLCPFGG